MSNKQIIQYKLADGTPVNMEVIDEDSEFQRVGRGREGDVIEATQSFEDALSTIAPAAQNILNRLQEGNHTPYEINLEFRLKFHAQAGVVFAAMGSDASFSVQMKWKGS